MYFNHLNYPDAWRAEYSKYPEGLSILESLMQWIRQVDDMVDSHNANQTTINGFGEHLDSFIAQYNAQLQTTLTKTLSAWQASGFLDVVIDAALQTEMDNLVTTTEQALDLFSEQLADTVQFINLNNPIYGVVGDGVTDDTLALQAVITSAIQNGSTVYASGTYAISDTLLFTYINGDDNFKVIGKNGEAVKFLAKINGKPAIKLITVANGLFKNGIELSNFSIEPFSDTYKHQFDGIELVNTMGVVLEKITITGCDNGLILTASGGSGSYTEQNNVKEMLIQYCLKAITFRTLNGANWNASFHGNIFDKVSLSVSGTSTEKAVAFNIEGGHLYNCLFAVKVFISGQNAYLFDINGSSGTNYGSISYEVFGIDPCKIKTGDNAHANFFINGSIHGLNDNHTIDWSEYQSVAIGNLDYANLKIPLIAGNSRLGMEKFYASNLLPPKELSTIQYWSGVPVLDTLTNNLNDLWQGKTHMLTRYHNKDGNEESGFLMACREVKGAGSRFILGYVPSDKKNIQDFIPGFYIMSDGSAIKSVSKDSQLVFTNSGISVYGDTLNIANFRTPSSSSDVGTTGDICWDANYIYVCIYTNTWRRAAIGTW